MCVFWRWLGFLALTPGSKRGICDREKSKKGGKYWRFGQRPRAESKTLKERQAATK